MGSELLELRRRIAADPVFYTVYNPAQIRFIRAVANGAPVTIATMGNGTGKTFAMVSILSAIIFPTKNRLFRGLDRWSYPKRLRICAPSKMVEDGGPLQLAMRELFPCGRYTQSKGMGRGYFCHGEADTGFGWDVMTYNQAPLEFASATIGGVFYSEPPTHDIWSENVARLRMGGITVAEMTPLYYSPWIKDEVIDIGELKTPDGKSLGRVEHVTGSVWENCRELYPGGQLPRSAVELILSQYPAEEREAREKGTFMHLAGTIYKEFSKETHVLGTLPAYHADCRRKGRFTLVNVIDPHDRKPFAIGWYLVFPNGDVLCVAEFPDDTYPLFHQIHSCGMITADYARMIKATEDAIGRPADVRLIDPNFGKSPCFSSGKTITQEFAEEGERLGYPLAFRFPSDALMDGHMAVKALLGNRADRIRSKFYVRPHCRNHIYGMSHYCWAENRTSGKGLSEKPELLYKDFPDLVRYGALSGFKYIKPSEPQPELWHHPAYFPRRKT